MSSKNNIERRLWEETDEGKLEKKMRKLLNEAESKKKLTPEHVRWIDIHRAQTMSKDTDISNEFLQKNKEVEDRMVAELTKLSDEYRKKWTDMMRDAYQKEIAYLEKII